MVDADLRTLFAATGRALDAAEAVLRAALARVKALVAPDGKVSGAALDREQMAAHGIAWMATYVEALRQLQAWAGRLDAAGRFGEGEALILAVGFGEYLAQIGGGIAMSQGEIVRPADFGLSEEDLAPLRGGDAAKAP